MDEREWTARMNSGERMNQMPDGRTLSEAVEQATAAPGEVRVVKLKNIFTRPIELDDEPHVCQTCGSVVVDALKHVKWHADA